MPDQDLAVSLEPYRLPIATMPPAAQRAHARGVRHTAFPPLAEAPTMLQRDYDPEQDGVLRAADGTALVRCTTALPGVTATMIDWWFGWHLPETARYQLWHPTAHLKARCKEDRSALSDDRARYIGNVSYVDEYIGAARARLAIEFQPPASFGFEGLDARGATAICARTTDRVLVSEGGALVHLVLPTARGSELRSGFWLGQIENRLPLVGALVTRLVNRAALRTRVLPDKFLLDLFQHCAEEMNHLPKFLPALYAAAHAPRDAQASATPAT